jgi:dTMP kinase
MEPYAGGEPLCWTRMARGRFVTLEGPEGAGKTTQLRLLADWLRSRGVDPVVTREPGGTRMGDRIREALFGGPESNADGEAPLPLTEAFLMNAARAQHVREVLMPAIEAGRLVLCDRYADATLAYQGYGHGLDLSVLRTLIDVATGGLRPDLTIYLDVPASVGLARRFGDGDVNHLDRMEVAFHERVIAGYKELISAEPGRWRVVDGTQPAEVVQAELRMLF